MKKIIAVILALALSLAIFSACNSDKPNGGTGTNQGSAFPEIKITDEVKEFKNAEGKVAYKVSYNVPEFTAEVCEQSVADLLNKYIAEFYVEKAFEFAESNVKNFRADEKEPREIKITHEIKYQSDYIASIVFSTAYSKNSSIIEARTFNLTDGTVLSIEQYYLAGKAETKANLIEQLKENARYTLSETETSEEHLNNIAEKFDPISFWLDGTGINFVYNKTAIIPGLGATAGVYEIFVDWSIAGTLGLAFSPDYIFVEETTAQ